MTVELPAGTLPITEVTGEAALRTNRRARYRYDLLDAGMSPLGELRGVRGASLTESAASTLKRGGRMAVTDIGQDVDWLTVRIHVVYEVGGYGQWGCGVHIPSMSEERWSG